MSFDFVQDKPWFTKTTLESGLPVLVAPMSTPSVTVVLMIGVGSKHEPAERAGISHFLEHFVFKGTEKFPTSSDVLRALDALGADHNAGTGKESTAYWVKVARESLPRALEVLGDIVFRPRLPEELLSLEKGTIIQEIAMYEDQPSAKVGRNFEEMMLGKDTRLGREIIGTRETVSAVTREDLFRYRSRWYQPERMVVGVAGGVNEKEIVPMVERHFRFQTARSTRHEARSFDHSLSAMSDELHASSFEHRASSNVPRVAAPTMRRSIEWRKTDQAHLIMGVPGLKRSDPRRYALGVLLTMLGGNSSSRLFQEVREKRGLAYAIRAGATKYVETGYVGIGVGVPTEKAAECEKLITEIATTFSFSDQELADAKTFITGQIALDWEDSHEIAGHLTEEFLFEPAVRSFDEIVGKIKAVTRDEVEALSKELLADPSRFHLAAVGMVDNDLRSRMKDKG